MTRRVLMVGATGMLRPAVHALTHHGHSVTAVSRQPRRATPPSTMPGRVTAVSADWRDPESLIDTVAEAAYGHLFPTAVVWVHSPYRVAVMGGRARVLTADAVVVQFWGSASQHPRDVLASEGVDLPGARCATSCSDTRRKSAPLDGCPPPRSPTACCRHWRARSRSTWWGISTRGTNGPELTE